MRRDPSRHSVLILARSEIPERDRVVKNRNASSLERTSVLVLARSDNTECNRVVQKPKRSLPERNSDFMRRGSDVFEVPSNVLTSLRNVSLAARNLFETMRNLPKLRRNVFLPERNNFCRHTTAQRSCGTALAAQQRLESGKQRRSAPFCPSWWADSSFPVHEIRCRTHHY
jgi:hypothetical protein